MAIELPKKGTPERRDEEARRKDLTQAGVAQEALDALEEIEARNGSSSEVFTEHGYSLSHVLKRAQKEEKRIAEELQRKPSKDISSEVLDVAAVKAKKGIPEWVKPTEPKGKSKELEG